MLIRGIAFDVEKNIKTYYARYLKRPKMKIRGFDFTATIYGYFDLKLEIQTALHFDRSAYLINLCVIAKS